MKSKSSVLVALAALIVFGIAAYFYYQSSRQQSTAESGAQDSASGTTTPPTDAPPAGTDAGATTGTADSNHERPATNMNPDMNVGEDGLSKATAVITTTKGQVTFKFYTKDAPNTVARIVELINQGFYNGLKFHRVVPGFVIQGGDPDGNGTGGSGKKLKAEFNQRKHREGTVAMARAADPDSADSQFYIALDRQPHLDGQYTVFGQVITGMDIVKSIQVGDKMESVVIQ
ncbi:MAG: peptidylprolyl isomerase [Bacteriovoracia bacterium]